jgi:hypothetical protein
VQRTLAGSKSGNDRRLLRRPGVHRTRQAAAPAGPESVPVAAGKVFYSLVIVRQQFIWHKYARHLTHHRKNSSIHHSHAMSSEAGKSALNKVASAIRTQTMSAWFSAGMAVSEAANIFDKKK